MSPARPRVLILVREFPQISQTYIKVELEALRKDYDLRVISLDAADIAEPEHHPFQKMTDRKMLMDLIRAFRPQVIHSHYMIMGNAVAGLAEATGLPFTLRSHSFDVLETTGEDARTEWAEIRAFMNRDNCLGVLCFPFLRTPLEQFGIAPAKLVEAPPVISFERFHDRGPNGTAVMNMGAVRPKKRMEDFVELSRRVPTREFNLYAMGYDVRRLQAYSASHGGRLNFIPPLSHNRMPAEYKKHEWLVYTASADMQSVGWPMALAEAQAAGVGVCMADIRPDLKDYVGRAGHLYRDLESVCDLISGPVPAEMREAGFEQARRSDIRGHIHKLTDLWQAVL